MKILIAGGGTAGHINPGIAIAKEFQRINKASNKGTDTNNTNNANNANNANNGTNANNANNGTDVMFVGTETGLESTIVPREGFNIKFIRVSGFRRRIGIDTFKTIGRLFKGISDAKKIINEFKPDIVIGTGGYVAGPVLFQASLNGIPTLIHEQNAFPGITNKILANFVDKICISFEESEKYFKKSKKTIYTGNPIRPELLNVNRAASRQSLGLNPDDKLVVISGGSRGAQQINKTMVDLIENFYKIGSYRLIFATGEARFEEVMKTFTKPIPEGVEVVRFIYDAAKIYAASDIMVCRAGAIIITELGVMGIPSILIPSPNVTANHQVFNAKVLEKRNAAYVIMENELSAKTLSEKILMLFNNKKDLINMSKNAKKAFRTDAATLIVNEAISLLATKK